MLNHMRDRGPDENGSWVSEQNDLALLHTRLSIIGLDSGSSQPMLSGCGRYCIIYNGEVYNYRALREELLARGIRFKGHSDTEVLLEMYALYGKEMLSQLEGMFAFAIWDKQTRSLLLVRDPLGIKPLYIHHEGEQLRFASQVKTLLASGLNPDLEPAGVVGYWLWGHVPEPFTIYKGIQSIQPGTWLEFSSKGLKKTGTFDSVWTALNGDVPTLLGEQSLAQAIEEAVEKHLVADVPAGVFLSSGIDSSVLVAYASQLNQKLQTITLGFEEYQGTENDETVLATSIAKYYGTDHHTVLIGQEDFYHDVNVFFDSMDQPSTDGLNTWLVAKAAKSIGLKVALSGLGADEIFGGYPAFHHVPLMRKVAGIADRMPVMAEAFRKISTPIFKQFTSTKYASLFELGGSWSGSYQLRRAQYLPWEIYGLPNDVLADSTFVRAGLERLYQSQMALDEAHLESSSTPDFLKVSYLELTNYMRCRLLRDADWAGMAHSVEIRVPYLDMPLIRRVAYQAKKSTPWSKNDLAHTAIPPWPIEVIDRKKTGFTLPIRQWMMASKGEKLIGRGLQPWAQFVLDRTLQEKL